MPKTKNSKYELVIPSPKTRWSPPDRIGQISNLPKTISASKTQIPGSTVNHQNSSTWRTQKTKTPPQKTKNQISKGVAYLVLTQQLQQCKSGTQVKPELPPSIFPWFISSYIPYTNMIPPNTTLTFFQNPPHCHQRNNHQYIQTQSWTLHKL